MDLPSPSCEQLLCIQKLEQGFHVCVNAQAGSGKSTTFFHCIRKWKELYPESQVIMLCYNVQLRMDSEHRLRMMGMNNYVDCFTIHAFAQNIFGSAIPDNFTLIKTINECDKSNLKPFKKYNLCLIDEAQDLSNTMLDVLKIFEHICPMRYMVVGDHRQAIYSYTRDVDLDLLKYPDKYLNVEPWAFCELNTSFRLTSRTTDFLNNVIKHPNETPIIGGNKSSEPNMPMIIYGTVDNLKSTALEIYNLCGRNPDKLAILSPSVKNNSFGNNPYGCNEISTMFTNMGVRVFVTNRRMDSPDRSLLQNKLIISTYHQSKGLEWDYVIVLGVDLQKAKQNGYKAEDDFPIVSPEVWVALTRAKKQLIIYCDSNRHVHPLLKMRPCIHDFSIVKEIVPPMCKSKIYPISRSHRVKHVDSIAFIPDNILREFIHNSQIELCRGRGRIINYRIKSSVPMSNGNVEYVGDIYWRILLFILHEQLEQKNKFELNTNALELVPKIYKNAYEHVRRGMLSNRETLVLYTFLKMSFESGYIHELMQLGNVDWFDKDDHDFIDDCHENINEMFKMFGYNKNKNIINSNRELKRKIIKDLDVTLIGSIPYRIKANDGSMMPLYLCLNEPSGEDYIKICLYMFLSSSVSGMIYCIRTDSIHYVDIDDDSLASIVYKILEHNRKTEFDNLGALPIYPL